jgi:hypothetical protein
VIDPALEAFMRAIHGLAVAKAAGRVTKQECAKAVAGAVLALELTREEIYIEAADLAQDQVARTMRRLLAESDTRRRSAS